MLSNVYTYKHCLACAHLYVRTIVQVSVKLLKSNVYTYKLINKTTRDIDSVHFKLLSHKGEVKIVRDEYFKVEGQEYAEGTLFIEIDEQIGRASCRERV